MTRHISPIAISISHHICKQIGYLKTIPYATTNAHDRLNDLLSISLPATRELCIVVGAVVAAAADSSL